MKKNKKLIMCTLTAVLGIMSAVPTAVYADWSTDEKGRIFYYTDDDTYLTGEQEIDGEKYLFSANGVLKTGWRTVDGQRRYYDPTTGKSVKGWFEYCGKDYYIDSENGKITGFFKETDDTAHLMSDKGQEIKEQGFQESDGKTYYINEDGTLAIGKTIINDDTYCFDGNAGYMLTGGFVESDNNEVFYLGEDGKALKGWQDIDDYTRYFKEDGVMSRGITEIDGQKYFFSETDGAMRISDWATSKDDKVYYSGADGVCLTGWQDIEGLPYYFNEDCTRVTGLVTLDDGTYIFGDNGVMLSGWQTVNDNQCYFLPDGKMAFGWKNIDGDEYFFNKYGIMETNTTIAGREIGEDGKAKPLSAVQLRANSVIAEIGTSTEAIYNFVRNNNRYSHMEETKSQAQIEAIGWSYFANYAFDNRFIVCYYYAAITDLLYKQAGYETRIVHGTGRGAGEHYWNEIKLNDIWYCTDTCNGYFQVSFEYLQSQNYTFYNYVYPKYA
ncbi:MAG: hypothetical protein K2K02_07740 [Ruminococcus sp.]|nr:hypothetical protein [Ruminococcus sp.]MDE6678918.1 hypothetical protein [Ruminococcus sp.]